MLIDARRPELLSLVGYDAGLLYTPSCIYYPRNMGGVSCLLICDQCLSILFPLRFILLAFLRLKRGGCA
jgi:hypothetical protein